MPVSAIAAPVGGTVIEVHVALGDKVTKDQHLFTMERGKTLLIVRSVGAGRVAELNVAEGDEIEVDFEAVAIEAD